MSDNPQEASGPERLKSHTIAAGARQTKEKKARREKRKQPGIGFPSAGIQSHLLVIRLNLTVDDAKLVQQGLKTLCDLFERIDTGDKRIDVLRGGNLERVPLTEFHFSATVGFGLGFFDTLKIQKKRRPKNLTIMPDHHMPDYPYQDKPNALTLRDPTPYSLSQTDMIIQLGSSEDYINRWVLENALEPEEFVTPATVPEETKPFVPDDIITAVRGWAIVTEVHAGFQRMDGRNLLGFNDGVSNPRRLSPLFDQLVWTTADDEDGRADFTDGTYMVFQKIVHDLSQWRALDVRGQEKWIGRSKGTGLLLGTLSPEEDAKLSAALCSNDAAVREAALKVWEPLFKAQESPLTPFYDQESDDFNGQPLYGDIPNRCPAWAHARKANPRQQNHDFDQHLIFRRGYPYMETNVNDTVETGLLFVCFQRDISSGFEFIKRAWLNDTGFPVPHHRPFNLQELRVRHNHARFTVDELKALTPEQRQCLGLDDAAFKAALAEAAAPRTQETGREGLVGPSEQGVVAAGQFLATVTLGGGYYFVPPIPDANFANVGQQFFE